MRGRPSCLLQSACVVVHAHNTEMGSSRTVLELEDPKSWPWPLTVPALASKWSGLGLGLDASASSHRSVINVLNL